MQGPDFIFFLQDKNRKFWQLDDTGKVVINSNAYPLVFSPDGWQDTGIQNVLNRKYWSIDRTVTVPFKYVEDGAKILKHIFYKKGTEEPVYLAICEQRLDFDPLPSAVMATVTGTNPFSAGTNTGTITGTPGETIYVKLTFTGDPAQDSITGNIGGGIFVLTSAVGSTVYPVIIPSSGIVNYNLSFTNTSTTANSKLELCTSTGSTTGGYTFWYKQTFRGEVDLTTFLHDGAYITANNTEEGLAKHLKANENTVYEIPLNDPNAISVKDDGIELQQIAKFNVADVTYTGVRQYFPALPLLSTELANLAAVSVFGQTFGNWFGGPTYNFSASTNYFFTTQKDIEIRIEAQIRLTTKPSFNGFIWIVGALNTAISPGPTGSPGVYFATGALTANALNVINIDETFTVPAGEKLFLHVNKTFNTDDTFELTDFKITFNYLPPTTYVKAHRPQFLLNEFMTRMSDGEYTAEDSPYLGDLQNCDKVFTSGNGLRGIADATLKMSFTQFMSFWNTYDEVGIREKNKKVLQDRKNTLTNQVNLVSLGAASNLKVSFDKDFPFNQMSVGYQDVKSENGMVNGKNEFNTTFVWSVGTTKNPRTYEKISQVQASCYAQELIRIENFLKDTTDNRSDNDPFVMHVEKEITAGNGSDIPDHYKLDRSLNAFLTGVDKPETIYNVSLSPRRCVNRSSDFLRSSEYLMDNKTLKFISCDRNKDMSYVNGSDVVVENADISIGGMDAKFFLPVIFEFDIPAPDDLLDDVDDDPTRCFEFEFDGNTYRGICIKNSINPGSNKSQTYQLLSTADNNLEKLIDYYGG